MVQIDRDGVARFLQEQRATDIRCNFEGEAVVAFRVDTLCHVREQVLAEGWHTASRAIIVDDLDPAIVLQALEESIEVERAYGYRSWRQRRPDEPASELLRVDYYGSLQEISTTAGWVDLAAVLTTGEAYTFTVETLVSLETEMAAEGDSPGWFSCPDLLVVRELTSGLIESAIRGLVRIGIWDYGILTQ